MLSLPRMAGPAPRRRAGWGAGTGEPRPLPRRGTSSPRPHTSRTDGQPRLLSLGKQDPEEEVASSSALGADVNFPRSRRAPQERRPRSKPSGVTGLRRPRVPQPLRPEVAEPRPPPAPLALWGRPRPVTFRSSSFPEGAPSCQGFGGVPTPPIGPCSGFPEEPQKCRVLWGPHGN